MRFRDRLLGTLKAIVPVLEVPDVLVVGSEVPNLLEPDAGSTLVVSQDVHIGVPVERHAEVKRALERVTALRPSAEEPSVWIPESTDLLEVNFVGMDPSVTDAEETYVLDDVALPLMVFGPLSLARPGPVITVDGLRLPLPRVGGLLVEKLLTERSGLKGVRDLLVALGLFLHASTSDFDEVASIYGGLAPDLRHAVRANLSSLSLMERLDGMPDPHPHRRAIAALLRRLEGSEGAP